MFIRIVTFSLANIFGLSPHLSLGARHAYRKHLQGETEKSVPVCSPRLRKLRELDNVRLTLPDNARVL